MRPDRKRVVAVTGGAGFLGQAVIQNLLYAGLHVKALQNRTPIDIEHENLEIISGSLFDVVKLSELVSGCESVVHCAGLVAAKRKKDFFTVNEGGTRDLLSACEKTGVKRFLLVSSIAAREPTLSPYAASKHAGETVVRDCKSVEWDILRPPAIYGPKDEQFLPLFALVKKGIGILPAGKNARVSIIYVDDLASAIGQWVLDGKAYNMVLGIDDGHAGGYVWQDILGKVAQNMGGKVRFTGVPKILLKFIASIVTVFSCLTGGVAFLSPGKVNELCHKDWRCQDRHFSEITGWSPAYDLEKGLKKTLSYYTQQGRL